MECKKFNNMRECQRMMACDDCPELIPEEVMIRNINLGNGSLDMQLEGGACRLLAQAFAAQFEESDATNYLEVGFHNEKLGNLTVTMQKTGAITPGQKAAMLAKAIREVSEAYEWWAVDMYDRDMGVLQDAISEAEEVATDCG